MVVLVTNIKYQSVAEIKSQYDGFCVCIVNFKGRPSRIEGGEVIAYGNSVAELTDEVRSIIDGKKRIFKSYKNFDDMTVSGVVQVVSHEN